MTKVRLTPSEAHLIMNGSRCDQCNHLEALHDSESQLCVIYSCLCEWGRIEEPQYPTDSEHMEEVPMPFEEAVIEAEKLELICARCQVPWPSAVVEGSHSDNHYANCLVHWPGRKTLGFKKNRRPLKFKVVNDETGESFTLERETLKEIEQEVKKCSWEKGHVERL